MRQPRVKKESEPGHPSPESEPGSPHIVASPISYPPTSSHASTPVLHLPQSSSQNWDESQRTPSPHITVVNQNLLTSNTPTNLLTVPQPSYLVKQHSHPLLPSQQSVSGSYLIHRQHSNPEYPGRSSSPSIVIDHAPLIKTEESGQAEGRDARESGGSSVGGLRVRTAELRRSSSSPQTGVRGEMRLSREGSSDQRLGHCPVQRPGPALGCNHCWNTIDAHGRILRRKTKYHCPECQTNLCIVPCFQEFHERQREVSVLPYHTLRPLPKKTY